MAKLVGIAAGLVVFVVWIMLVGNPHVVETAFGVGIATFCGWWVYSKARNAFRQKTG